MDNSIHRISRFGLVNAYLVVEDDGITVIDTMIPGSTKGILAEAGRLGTPIVRIALTHAHGDHIGSLDALAAALPEAEVIISERDAPLLAGDKTLREDEPGPLKGSYPGAKTRPSRTVAGGDTIGSLEVIPSPGHTPGHVAFRDTRDDTLYCGDAYATLGGVATSAKVNWRFPLPAMATWNRARELESARELHALNPSRLAPGHGKVVEQPGAAMDRAIVAAALMPRRGLDAARVVGAAGDIADAEGVDAATLSAVAAALGVRPPSLYNHVGSREAMITAVAAAAMAELGDTLRDAAMGRAGEDALLAVAAAYRAYAHAHPGRYALIQRGPRGDAESAAAAAAAVAVFLAVVRGYGLEGDAALHATRAVRSALHGFVSLEGDGGFALPLDRDASFARLVALLDAGLAAPRAG